jgi:hypothetical protein
MQTSAHCHLNSKDVSDFHREGFIESKVYVQEE